MACVGAETVVTPNGFAAFGPGVCPTAVPSFVAPGDFMGRWRFRGVCGVGTLKPGVTWLDTAVDFEAGIPAS
ncbi:MAG: hypothetical protein ACREQY_02390 [Candidatus Binatia bacterium]